MNSCLPHASAPTSTWPSTSAAESANRPCGLPARTSRPPKASVELVREPVEGVPLRHRSPTAGSGGSSPVCSYDASWPIRRTCRSSPLNGSARKTSTKRVMSSSECIRPPTETTLASLCSRARRAVSSDHTSAARMPLHLVGRHLLAVAGAADHDAEAVQAGGPVLGDSLGRPQAERPGSRRGRRSWNGPWSTGS